MNPLPTRRGQAGLTLIELLVTVIILSIGVLGLAGMQTASLRYTQDSYLQTTAMNIAQEIVDRMRANPAAVDNGTYGAYAFNATDTAPSAVDCTTGCTPAQVAQNDAFEVFSYFQDVYDLGADKFVPALPAGSSAAIARSDIGDDAYFTVTVSWPHTSANVATDEGGVRNVMLEVIL